MSTTRSTRGRWAAATLLLAVLVGASALPVWVSATGASALSDEVAVRVAGSAAAPAVPATALVLAAAGAAVALAGRVGRWVVAAIVLLGGGAVAGAAVGVLADPQGPALAASAELTGVDHLVGPAAATAAPWLAAALGALVVAAAVGLVRSSATWPAPNRRHEGAPGRSPDDAPGDAPDERADWDALSRGADPSDGPGGQPAR